MKRSSPKPHAGLNLHKRPRFSRREISGKTIESLHPQWSCRYNLQNFISSLFQDRRSGRYAIRPLKSEKNLTTDGADSHQFFIGANLRHLRIKIGMRPFQGPFELVRFVAIRPSKPE